MNICPIGTAFSRIGIFKNTSTIKNTYCNFNTLSADTVSFSGKKPSLKTQIEQMPEKAFPSLEYREYLINELSKPDNEKDLIDIHQEYYVGLLDCKTLDKAKEKYPEFENVTDAKDIDLDTVGKGKQMLIQILKGDFKQADNLTIDNFSLELLKKYYAQTLTLRDKENYWGITKAVTSPLLDLLNIKMSPGYSKMIDNTKRTRKTKIQWADSNYREKMAETRKALQEDSDYRAKMVDLTKTRWQEDSEYREKMAETRKALQEDSDYRAKMADLTKTRWQEDSDYRKKMTDLTKTRWEEDSEFREKASASLRVQWQDHDFREKKIQASRTALIARWQDPDYRKKMTQVARTSMTARWQDPDFRMLMEIVYSAREAAFDMHPECRQVCIDVAKDFPMLGKINEKIRANEELTEFESITYKTYWKKCDKIKLNVDGKELRVKDIIGQCQKEILASWGFREKDRDIYKIAENIGLIENE